MDQHLEYNPETRDLNTRSLDELLGLNIPERKPLLGSWLREGHLSMVYAPAGVGKSMFTMSIALAVSGGGNFLCWSSPGPRRVLIVDGEMDMFDLKERAKLLIDTIPGIDKASAGHNLHILAKQDQPHEASFPDISCPCCQTYLLAKAREMGADLVILDNFSTLANIEEENKASAFNPVMNLLNGFRQEGRACILVHHSRKGGKARSAYRGTSMMEVILNSMIALNHPDGLPSNTGAAFELEFQKFRGLRDETVRPMNVRLVRNEDGAATEWLHEATADDQILEMIAHLKSLKYATQEELAEAVGVSTGKLSQLKNRAIANGLIQPVEWKDSMKIARAERDLKEERSLI